MKKALLLMCCCLLAWMVFLRSPVLVVASPDRYRPLTFIPDDPTAPVAQGYSAMPEDYRVLDKRGIPTPIKRNRCELKLVADYEFFRVIGSGNYANAVRYLVNLIERINNIFTSVDWGLDINGDRLVDLGFSIKEIKILDKPTNVPMHFNSIVPFSEDGTFSAHDVLKSFSVEEGTNTTCMTVLITAKVFNGSILGVANIGDGSDERGICATRLQNNSYANTAVISVRRKSELIITRVVDLVVAHELGHAWGSPHDNVNDPDCSQPDAPSGRYIMHESSNAGYEASNYNFSPCSVRAIHKMLYSLAHRCFVEEKPSLCGNGIVEPGEECDNGKYLSAEGSSNSCCTANCKVKPGAVCSPIPNNKSAGERREEEAAAAYQMTHPGFFKRYFVFVIVAVSLAIWCPCGAYIVHNDQKNVESRGGPSADDAGDFIVIVNRRDEVQRREGTRRVVT